MNGAGNFCVFCAFCVQKMSTVASAKSVLSVVLFLSTATPPHVSLAKQYSCNSQFVVLYCSPRPFAIFALFAVLFFFNALSHLSNIRIIRDKNQFRGTVALPFREGLG